MLFVLDLGSRHLGAVTAEARLPLQVLASATGAVDPANLAAVVNETRVIMATGRVEAIVLEIAPRFFAPANATPQAITAMAEAYATCSRLAERFGMLAAEYNIPVHRIARQTWAHRVVPHARGITEEMAHAGIRARLVSGWTLLRDEHQRDAAGAAIGYLLGLEKEEKERARSPRRAGKLRAADPAPVEPSRVEAIVSALAAHGRPIRHDVLAVRLAVTAQTLKTWLRSALKTGRIVRPQRGIYALP